MKQTIFSRIEAQEDNAIALLRRLISHESVASPTGKAVNTENTPLGDCLEDALAAARELGLFAKNLDGIAGIIDTSEHEAAEIGILCHLDVVPAGDGWTHPPFAGEIENGKLYGRGATDDKGPFVSALLAVAALKACGAVTRYPIRLIAGTCEETGSADIAYCKERGVIPKIVFSPDASYPVINTEKGICRFSISAPFPKESRIAALSGGEVINMVPQSATVRFRDGTVTKVHGRAAHASTPELGENAITKLLFSLTDTLRKDASYELLRTCCRLHPPHETDGSSLGIAASEPIAGNLTCSLDLMELKDGLLTLSFDVRYPLNVTEEGLKNALYARLSDTPFTLGNMTVMPPHHVSADTPLVRCLLSAYSSVTGREGYTASMGGGTYVHDIDGGVAFGTVFPEEDCRIHSPDEFIHVKDLTENAKIFAEALLLLQDETL